MILFDVKSGKRTAEIGDEEDSVLAADISTDHRFVALGGPLKSVKIFETKSGKLLHRIKKHTDWITAIAFSPEGDHVATADRNGGIHIWEAEKGAIVFSLSEHKVRVTDLDWRSDGKMLASVADDGVLILWDMKDGWPSKVVDAHKSKSAPYRHTKSTGVLAADWNRSGEIVTVGRDRIARLWSADGNKAGDSAAFPTLPTAVAYDSEKGEKSPSECLMGGWSFRPWLSQIGLLTKPLITRLGEWPECFDHARRLIVIERAVHSQIPSFARVD